MIKLDTSILLGNGSATDQARGAKIGGGKGGSPMKQPQIELDARKLLGDAADGQAAGAKIGFKSPMR